MNLEQSFEAFYRQYYASMVSYCYHTFQISRPDSEDLVGEAFTQLWQQYRDFDNYSLPILIAWTRKTIRYLAYSYHRKQASAPVTVELGQWIAQEESQGTEASVDPMDDPISNEQVYQTYLNQIRRGLSRHQLRLFDCIIVGQHDITTAAKLLGMKENTVKVGLKRLRHKLKTDILPDLLNH